MADTPSSSLFQVPPGDYGSAYKEHLLEQYKLYVESADKVSQRRVSANNYLLTVNAFLITLYGLAASLPHAQAQAWQYVVPAAGVLVCVTWFELIRSYRNLNTAKFKVIHDLEKVLPVALFEWEWKLAEQGQGKAYKPLTHIEKWIPIVFIILYIILGIHSVIGQPAHGQP